MHITTSILPKPPLAYYPAPPLEPVWREQRQRHHLPSLHHYIGELFVWTELCRSEILFRQEIGLPVARQEVCDAFLAQCLDFIREWMATLMKWTGSNDPD